MKRLYCTLTFVFLVICSYAQEKPFPYSDTVTADQVQFLGTDMLVLFAVGYKIKAIQWERQCSEDLNEVGRLYKENSMDQARRVLDMAKAALGNAKRDHKLYRAYGLQLFIRTLQTYPLCLLFSFCN